MKTKEEFIAECKDANPTMTQVINGEEIELDAKEYEKVVEAWADSQMVIQEFELAKAEQEASKSALLERLNITQEEATLLLG
jgi:hypothetical protein